jgi:protein SCO1/2
MKHAALLLLWLLPMIAAAGPLALPPAPQADYVQRLDARLPLQSVFTDDNGSRVHLKDFFDDKPVVLVLGYYHCPNLCSTLMDGVLQTLSRADLSDDAYRLVAASIDPTETAGFAARRKVAYMPMLGRHRVDMHLLTGSRASVDALARAAGFRYAYDAPSGQYAHPSGFLIATPEGRISHYFMGVHFDPADIKLALVQASSGSIGSPTDRLLLMCSHYDPASGRYSVAAMTTVRIAGLAVLIALAGWIVFHRARGGVQR